MENPLIRPFPIRLKNVFFVPWKNFLGFDVGGGGEGGRKQLTGKGGGGGGKRKGKKSLWELNACEMRWEEKDV